MPERLTTALDSGTVAILQAFAGGPRMIGRYLSDLARWLWANRMTMQGKDLATLVVMPRAELDALQEGVAALAQRDDSYRAEVTAQLDDLQRKFDELAREFGRLSQDADDNRDDDGTDGDADDDAHSDA